MALPCATGATAAILALSELGDSPRTDAARSSAIRRLGEGAGSAAPAWASRLDDLVPLRPLPTSARLRQTCSGSGGWQGTMARARLPAASLPHRSLAQRARRGPRDDLCDGGQGLIAALPTVYPGIPLQRCCSARRQRSRTCLDPRRPPETRPAHEDPHHQCRRGASSTIIWARAGYPANARRRFQDRRSRRHNRAPPANGRTKGTASWKSGFTGTPTVNPIATT